MTLSLPVSSLVDAVCRVSCHRVGSLGADAETECEVKGVDQAHSL